MCLQTYPIEVPPVAEDAPVFHGTGPRHLVAIAFRAPYKCTYLLTYLPNGERRNRK